MKKHNISIKKDPKIIFRSRIYKQNFNNAGYNECPSKKRLAKSKVEQHDSDTLLYFKKDFRSFLKKKPFLFHLATPTQYERGSFKF